MQRNFYSKSLLVLLLLFSLSLTALSAHANLIDRGIFTYDNRSKLDWLDLSILAGVSYQSVLNGYDGYTTSGWRYATTSEVLDLFTRYVSAPNGQYLGHATNEGYVPNMAIPNAASGDIVDEAYDLILLMGMNLAFRDARATYNVDWDDSELHQVSIQGYFDDDDGGPRRGVAELTAVLTPIRPFPPTYETIQYGRWSVIDNQGDGQAWLHISSFLVRDHPLPTPSTLVLLFAGGLGLACLRSRKRRDRRGIGDRP